MTVCALLRPPQRGRDCRHVDTTSDQFDRGADLPRWYRLDRVGDTLTASVSSDGQSWTPVDQRRVDAADTVYAGLAVCSHDTDSLAEARFDAVRVEELDVGPDGEE